MDRFDSNGRIVPAIKSGAMTNTLMVCMGNICRSPMAQTIARKLAADANLSQQLRFDSAGTHAHRLGEWPDPRVKATLSRHGYEMELLRSRRIATQDFQHFDLILAMDADNLSDLRRLCPPEYSYKLRLLLDFAEGLTENEIPDPYYGNVQGFERVLELCEAGVKGFLKQWS